jgi:hypothetical protein
MPEDQNNSPTPVDNTPAPETTPETKPEVTDGDSVVDNAEPNLDDIIDDEVKNYKPDEKVVAPEDEDEVDKEERLRVEKIMQNSKYGATIEQIQRQSAMDSYLAANPEFAKYKPAIEKYWNHPTYRGLPIHNVAAIVAGKDMMKIGAAKEREAQKQADSTINPGTSTRPAVGGTVNWQEAPKEEFEAQLAKVLGRQGI